MSPPERITYLARRNPSFRSRAVWVRRWRAHWELAARQPESATVHRYAQCEVIEDTTVPPHDAVAFAEYASPEERARNRAADRYHAIMRADELVVFDRTIAECSFLGTHHMIAGVDRGPVKVVRFLRGHRNQADWDARATEVLDAHLPLGGYAQTRASPPPPTGWGLEVGGCEEFWVGSFEEAQALAAFPCVSDRRDLHARVVTVEAVLKDSRVVTS